MELYNLYAGLSGGFGGYQYHCTEEYNSKDEALEAARQLAIEEYQSYEGCHGLTSEEDILEQYLKDNGLSLNLTMKKSGICIWKKLKVGCPIQQLPQKKILIMIDIMNGKKGVR